MKRVNDRAPTKMPARVSGQAVEGSKSRFYCCASTQACTAWYTSRRPLPIPGFESGTDLAMAAAAVCWFTAGETCTSNAAVPETKGALNEVPQPAEYVPYG